MTSLASYERTHLCALAQQLGPDAPTLCGGWTVKDLVVHLLLRERNPAAAAGMFVPPLAPLLDRASRQLSDEEFSALVGRLRHGAPPWSLFAVPRLGDLLNTLEFFVHHEDVRRAQPVWEPRTLPRKVEDSLWRAVRVAGRGLALRSPVALVVERSDTGERSRLKGGDRQVVLRGRPSELVLYLYGRKEQSEVSLDGDAQDVAAVAGAPMGV